MKGALRLVATGAALAFAAPPASAHLVQTGFGTFYDGIAHLVLTPADVLVVLALALFAGLRGRPESRSVALVLPLAWFAGGLLGRAYPGIGELPWATTATVLAGGLLVATNARLPRWAVELLAGLVGLLHGSVNGATMAPGGVDVFALVGLALAVFTLACLVPAVVVGLRAEWTRIAVRVAGSWIAAVGLLLLGWLARA